MADEREQPEPKPVDLGALGTSAASGASLHITTPAHLSASGASSSAASATISSIPLVHVATASVYPGGSGSPQVVITRRPESRMPDVEVSLNENIWDLTTTGFGVTVGAVVGHVPGAVVGGIGA